MSSKIRLSSPHMGGEELKYIRKALDANWVAPVGENISAFERDLESYLGENVHVAALSSGTAALHLALILAGVQYKDTVICQSLTFAASAFPILYLGANPVFVDSEAETWNMCPELLEKAIVKEIENGHKPKAIVMVHIFGMPAKMREIVRISNKYKIPIIEDAAEALGSEYYGRKCGTFGDFGILSFNGNKIITTSGGGVLVCKNKALKKKAIFLATQSKDDFDWYEHSQIGYNYRMSNILAGIGRGQMKVLEQNRKRRREHNQFYRSFLQSFQFISIFQETLKDVYSNHWLSCIQIDSNEKNKTIRGLKEYLDRHDIESKYIWKPLHLQPIFKEFSFYGNGVSERIFKRGLCLPSSSNLSDSEKDTVRKITLEYLND